MLVAATLSNRIQGNKKPRYHEGNGATCTQVSAATGDTTGVGTGVPTHLSQKGRGSTTPLNADATSTGLSCRASATRRNTGLTTGCSTVSHDPLLPRRLA